jgi:MinD superfamily P-loop ATPase
MNRKEFLKKSAGMILLGGLCLTGIAAEQVRSDKKYKVIPQRCNGCGHCYRSCRDQALTASNNKAVIDTNKCKGCGECTRYCRSMAIVESKR